MAPPPPPQWAKVSSLSRIHDHTQTHHSRYDSSGRVIRPSQRPLLDSTHHSGRIRTRSPSKWAAAHLSPRPRGHWDRRFGYKTRYCLIIYIYIYIHSYTLLRRGTFSSISIIQRTKRTRSQFRICTYTMMIRCIVFLHIYFCGLKMAHRGRNMSSSA